VITDVIVVDDGSVDGSADVASRYPVRVVRQDHTGVSAARNAGLRLARASLIGFCDHDDEWVPTKAARQISYLDDHPDVDCVMCRQRIVLAPGIDPPSWLPPDSDGDIGGPLPMSGLFRAEVLEAIGGFDEELAGNEDLDLLVRMRELGHRSAVIDDRLVVRHVHDGNWSHGPGSYTPGLFEVLRRSARRSRA
jgi:glycosyltransferase involved in cell wall biosynthesis